MFMKTINGKPVSEEQIDAWVTEAEKGYDVEILRRRGRKPRNEDTAKVISIRLSPREILDLDKYAAAHGWSRSQAIREALKNAI
jgi:predicted transcriptional regulator